MNKFLRNLTVGKKIFTGFLGAILLIAFLAGVSLVSTISRTGTLNRVDTMSDIQAAYNLSLDEFDDARVNSIIAFELVSGDDTYQTIYKHLEAALTYLDTADALAEKIKYENEGSAVLRQYLVSYRAAIEAEEESNAQLEAQMENMVAAAAQLAQAASALFDEVSAATLAATTGQPEATEGLMRNLLLPAQRLSESANDLRAVTNEMLLTFDVGLADEMNEQLDSVEALAAAMSGFVTTGSARSALESMDNAIASFHTSLDEYAEVMIESDDIVDSAEILMRDIRNKMGEILQGVNEESSNLIAKTISSSRIGVILSIVLSLVAILLAVLIALKLGKGITRPLHLMCDVLVDVGETGNLNFSDETRNNIMEEANRKDELGQSLTAFVKMMTRMVYVGRQLETIADGDLSQDVVLLSANDTMGHSLQKMTDNLNEMFSEIDAIARQVAASSSEIAIGSQNLAQGATEQASTIQQISASISEINGQAVESVQTATEAAHDGEHIRDIALEGNEKMSNMMGAVQDISDSSKAIEKVIKVIEDIARQTNILALNAAVEAARAGEHGRGFAVVADEVRNLAGKSAEAAQETATLIQASVAKAGLGLDISTDTASSLSEIVDAIQKTSQSLGKVAQQSEASRAATSQVNLAVEQAAMVVQQNSATSEESAAASEQMSSQAQVLQQLVARFKLRSAQFGQAGSAAQLQLPTYDAPIEVVQPPPVDDGPIF